MSFEIDLSVQDTTCFCWSYLSLPRFCKFWQGAPGNHLRVHQEYCRVIKKVGKQQTLTWKPSRARFFTCYTRGLSVTSIINVGTHAINLWTDLTFITAPSNWCCVFFFRLETCRSCFWDPVWHLEVFILLHTAFQAATFNSSIKILLPVILLWCLLRACPSTLCTLYWGWQWWEYLSERAQRHLMSSSARNWSLWWYSGNSYTCVGK